MNQSVLGPTLGATLISGNLNLCVAAWCDCLQQRVYCQGSICAQQAENWHTPELAGAKVVWLENQLGEPWLRIIEIKDSQVKKPFRHSGWLSLEICVEDVDQLYGQLQDSAFEIIGEPAELDVSANIRAMQAVGPAGEVLYLTQIKAAVAGFELPSARCPVDQLFIPVLLTTDRRKTLDVFEQFSNTKGIHFDTKITTINNSLRLPKEQRHPVATIQLSGNHLIEIDQLSAPKLKQQPEQLMTSGIGMVSFAIASSEHFPANSPVYTITEGPFSGLRAHLLKGYNGELIELIAFT